MFRDISKLAYSTQKNLEKQKNIEQIKENVQTHRILKNSITVQSPLITKRFTKVSRKSFLVW